MTPTPDSPPSAGPRRGLMMAMEPLPALCIGLAALGTALGGSLLFLPQRGLLANHLPAAPVLVGLVLLAALSEFAYVRVPHGETTEDLTFLEAVVLFAAMALPPFQVLAGALTGLAAAWLLMRRPPVKTAFNLGMYSVAISALLLVAHGLGGRSGSLDAVLVGALLAGTAVFALVNTVALAGVMAIVQGIRPLSWLRQEWVWSSVMVTGNAGIAIVSVSMADTHPVLLPFNALPMLAVFHSYRASQKQAIERDRANALVGFSSALAMQAAPAEVIDGLVPPLRTLFNADSAAILMPGEPSSITDEAQEVVPLDLGADEHAVLVLGWRDGQSKSDRPFRAGRRHTVDQAMLATVAGAVASVLRAGRYVAALTEESSKLQAVVDHASDGIAVIDDTGEVVLWSPSMRRLVGDPPPSDARPQGDAVVALLASLCKDPAASRAVLAEALPSVRPKARAEVTAIGPQGEERDLEVGVNRIGGAGGWRLAVLTARDATEERRVEKMKSDFVATVSHELRTPITPIKGYARLLASRGDRMEPARRLHALQLIEDRADHLSRLVDDLLLASRVQPTEPGRLAVDLVDADLRNVVRQAVSAYPLLSDRIDVRLPARPVPVRCDVIRTVQCLANLIGNAEKYSPDGSPIVVELVDEPTAPMASVMVRDRGRGIPAAELERIFERFHRVENPFTMQTGGSGLGLFIGRTLARAMGGDISVTSTVGEGSTFCLRLPNRLEETPAAAPAVWTLVG